MGGKILDYEAKDIMNEGRREGRKEGRKEGRREGINEGVLKTLFSLVRDGILSVADAASRADLTEDVFNAKMQAYKGD